MTGRVWRLPTVVFFDPEAGLAVPVSGLDEVGSFLKMASLRGLMVATVVNSAINATVCK